MSPPEPPGGGPPKPPTPSRSAAAPASTAPLVVRPEAHGVSERDQRALLRIAGSLRAALEASVDVTGSTEVLEHLAEQVEATADALAAASTGKPIRLMGWYADEPEPSGMLPYSPVMGRLNPMAPPMRLEIEGRTGVGHVELGSQYQGAHGIAHGGVVAALFDEVLAFGTMVGGAPGPTGELRVWYRKPTPLFEPLRFEAWVHEVRERTTVARGRCRVGDDVCAEAEGVFVRIRPTEGSHWAGGDASPPAPGPEDPA